MKAVLSMLAGIGGAVLLAVTAAGVFGSVAAAAPPPAVAAATDGRTVQSDAPVLLARDGGNRSFHRGGGRGSRQWRRDGHRWRGNDRGGDRSRWHRSRPRWHGDRRRPRGGWHHRPPRRHHYDRHRHGPRYKHRRKNYRYHYGGWWYAFPWWSPFYWNAPYWGTPAPRYNDRCAYWHRRCVENWGYNNPDYRGCMRYYGCY